MFVGGFGWFWVVLGSFGWFWMVLDGFGWFHVLVTTVDKRYETRGHSGLHSAFQGMDVSEIAICYFTETHTRW